MDNGGIWPGDESYFQNIRETALQDTIEQLTKELVEARAEIERLKGVVISQITPEPIVLSSYSTTAEPAKDERDKLIEQMRDALRLALAECWSICCENEIRAALSAAERMIE